MPDDLRGRIARAIEAMAEESFRSKSTAATRRSEELFQVAGFCYSEAARIARETSVEAIPMFRWYFGIIIQATNGAFDISRKIDLPFVPQPEMRVQGVFCHGCELTIESITYDIEDKKFSIFQKEDDCDWGRDFTTDDARSYMDYGCLVDEESDPDI